MELKELINKERELLAELAQVQEELAREEEKILAIIRSNLEGWGKEFQLRRLEASFGEDGKVEVRVSFKRARGATQSRTFLHAKEAVHRPSSNLEIEMEIKGWGKFHFERNCSTCLEAAKKIPGNKEVRLIDKSCSACEKEGGVRGLMADEACHSSLSGKHRPVLVHPKPCRIQLCADCASLLGWQVEPFEEEVQGVAV